MNRIEDATDLEVDLNQLGEGHSGPQALLASMLLDSDALQQLGVSYQRLDTESYKYQWVQSSQAEIPYPGERPSNGGKRAVLQVTHGLWNPSGGSMKHKNSYRFTRFTLSKAPGFLVRSFGDLAALHPGSQYPYRGKWGWKDYHNQGPSGHSCLHQPNIQSLEAEAVLLSGETEWFLSLSSNRLEQKRIADGLITTLPGRNDAFADAYWFPLHELLTKEGVGEAFLEAIRKEMQGGVDLERAVREAGGIESFSRKRHTLVQTLKEKQRLVREQQAVILENLDLRQNISDLQDTLRRE